MSDDQLRRAGDLLRQRRYAEARALLNTLDHPTAREWLARLDLVAPETPVPPPDTAAQLAQARDLLRQRRYAEARALLNTLDHPTAREWLARLDQVAPQAPPANRAGPDLSEAAFRAKQERERARAADKEIRWRGMPIKTLLPVSIGIAVVVMIAMAAVMRLQSLSGPIVFQSDRSGDFEIYLANLDGSSVHALTDNRVFDGMPNWSPDGRRIVYTSGDEAAEEIWVMNADGSGALQLTSNGARDSYGAFSPDGARIAFASDRDGDYEIFVMNADGTDPRQITHNDAPDSRPHWSPDGAQIVFMAGPEGSEDLWAINTDGSDGRRLTDYSGSEGMPAWSPDGALIAFESNRTGSRELYTIRAGCERLPEGCAGTLRQLTSNAWDDRTPSWSPDGAQIVYHAAPSGSRDVYLMNADGSGARQVTTSVHEDAVARWRR